MILLLVTFTTTNTQCSTGNRIDAHRLNPPRYCNAFNATDTCNRHYTPRSLCEWDESRELCVASSTCQHRITAPTGKSYIFFKFHKVGSSTVGGTLRLALIASTGNVFTSCLRVQKLRNKTETERARYMHCSLCAKHDNTLPLLQYFRQPVVLDSSPSHRLAALFAVPGAADVLDKACPQRASIGNTLFTGTVFRRPVDRMQIVRLAAYRLRTLASSYSYAIHIQQLSTRSSDLTI